MHAAALLLYSCSQISQQHTTGTGRHTASSNNSRRSSSISPVHSNHSAASFKSYSARRFERDIEMRLKAAKRRQESSLSLVKQRSRDKLLEDNKDDDEVATTTDPARPAPDNVPEPSTSECRTTHITRSPAHINASPPREKPLSLPFAQAPIGQPLSLPMLRSEPTAGTSKDGAEFEWITTPT